MLGNQTGDGKKNLESIMNPRGMARIIAIESYGLSECSLTPVQAVMYTKLVVLGD